MHSKTSPFELLGVQKGFYLHKLVGLSNAVQLESILSFS